MVKDLVVYLFQWRMFLHTWPSIPAIINLKQEAEALVQVICFDFDKTNSVF